MATIGAAIIITGSVCFVGAVAWWYAFFEQFLGTDVKKASECFYFSSDFCALGDLVSFVGDIPAYRPWAFWVSVSIIGVGILVLALSPVRRRERL